MNLFTEHAAAAAACDQLHHRCDADTTGVPYVSCPMKKFPCESYANS